MKSIVVNYTKFTEVKRYSLEDADYQTESFSEEFETMEQAEDFMESLKDKETSISFYEVDEVLED